MPLPAGLAGLAGLSGRSVGVVLAVAAAAVLAFIVLGAVGVRFDPFGLQERKLENAQADAARAKTEATTAQIEAAGARDTTTRVEIALSQTAAAQDGLIDLSNQSRSAPDATEPLDPDRADRLHAFDQQLCAIRPALCDDRAGTATTKGHAGDSTGPVPVGRSPS